MLRMISLLPFISFSIFNSSCNNISETSHTSSITKALVDTLVYKDKLVFVTSFYNPLIEDSLFLSLDSASILFENKNQLVNLSYNGYIIQSENFLGRNRTECDDFNFDFYPDLRFPTINNGSKNATFSYYIFDYKSEIFLKDSLLSELPNLQWNHNSKTIQSTSSKAYNDFEIKTWIYVNGKLSTISKVYQFYSDSAKSFINRKDTLINGKWKVTTSQVELN